MCCRAEYESAAGPPSSPLLKPGRKLIRLLELGREFLHAVSPTESHPTKKHALLIQTMIQAGRGNDTARATPANANSPLGFSPSTFPNASIMSTQMAAPAYFTAQQGHHAVEGLSLSPHDQHFQYYAGPDPILGLSNDLGFSDALMGMMEWNAALGPV